MLKDNFSNDNIFKVNVLKKYLNWENLWLGIGAAVWGKFPPRTCESRPSAQLMRCSIASLMALLLVVLASGTASAQASVPSPNVFGSRALPIARTPMDRLWQSVRNGRIPAGASSVAQLISRNRMVSREEQVAAVNVWVNHNLSYVADRTSHGQSDRWLSVSQSLTSGRGDCEDFAIAKYQILRELGFEEQDIYMVVGREISVRLDHAIVAVRMNDGFLIMDNVTDRVLTESEMVDFLPTFSFSSSHTWIHGFSKE